MVHITNMLSWLLHQLINRRSWWWWWWSLLLGCTLVQDSDPSSRFFYATWAMGADGPFWWMSLILFAKSLDEKSEQYTLQMAWLADWLVTLLLCGLFGPWSQRLWLWAQHGTMSCALQIIIRSTENTFVEVPVGLVDSG